MTEASTDRAERNRSLLLAAPALLTIVVLMLVPMAIALTYSFLTPSPYGGVERPFTASSYLRFLYERDFDGHLVFDPTYLIIFTRSVLQAGAATALCIAIGFPLAWWMATRPPRRQQLLVLLVTVPFWTNLLIRTYCWVLILRDDGLVNQALTAAHLTSRPITFLYSNGAIALGLVYANLPFMVLPIYAAVERVDPRMIEAAYDLYADRSVVLRRVMIGTLIQQEFTSARDWSFGAALSTVLMVAVLLALLAGAWRRAVRTALP